MIAKASATAASTTSEVGSLAQHDPTSFVRTSWHFLHEDLDETILADRTEVLHDVPVFQPLVQSDLLVEGLRIPWRQTGTVRFEKPCTG